MKTVIGSRIGAKRPRYFHGRLLTAADFQLEQQYTDGRLCRLALVALGPGVVEGLVISAFDGSIVISPGVAVDPLGRLIELTEPCKAALPAATGAWNVFVELEHEPCDAAPASGVDESSGLEATMLRDVIRIWLAQSSGDPTDEGSAVWLGRLHATAGTIEVLCAAARRG